MRAGSLTLTYDVETGPSGPDIGAFFDLDGTLIAGFSALAFVRDRVKSGRFTLQDIADVGLSAASFRRGGLGFSGMMAAMARMLRETPERELELSGERLFDEQLASLIYADARRLVAAHRAQGHTIAVVSAATRYQTAPIARDLGIDDILCTQLEVKGGKLTGRVREPVCWGRGKLDAARGFTRERGVDLRASYFYADGYEDLPLLESVGHPRPTNPDRDLARLARSRAWPVLILDHSRPTRVDGLRTAAAAALAPTATASSAAAALVSGRVRGPLNLCVRGWSAAIARVAGLQLRVRGRRHLGSMRPAVFVFNSESAIDGLIVARLLRRDVALLAAPSRAGRSSLRALSALPNIAFVEAAGSGGWEAQAAALAALRDGISLVAAAEATRRPGAPLRDFRLTPFRLALEAGVPVVPIVIHNATERLPVGAVLVRSGIVDVEVLRPIETRAWSRRGLRAEIDRVRSQFAESLGIPIDGRKRRAAAAAAAAAGEGAVGAPG